MRWKQPAVILIAAVLCFPFIRYVHWLGDEGVLLHGAQRMLAGDRIYKDFFEFLPPLPFLVVAGWLKLVGMSLFGARILAIAVIAGIAAAIRSACGAGRLGTAIALGWILASQGAMTVVNHRWFATLLAMLAIALLVRLLDGSRSIALALAMGLCQGAAAMCTPTFGLLGVCALAILLSARRPAAELGAVIAGGLVVPALMILYLHGSLHEAAHDVLGFLFARYASIQRVRFGSGVGFQNFLIVACFPALVVLAILVRPRPFFATGLLALCGLVLAFPRPDATHLGFAVPLACPFLATCLRNLAPRRIFDVAAIAALGATLVAYVDVAQTVLRLAVVGRAGGGGAGAGGRAHGRRRRALRARRGRLHRGAAGPDRRSSGPLLFLSLRPDAAVSVAAPPRRRRRSIHTRIHLARAVPRHRARGARERGLRRRRSPVGRSGAHSRAVARDFRRTSARDRRVRRGAR